MDIKPPTEQATSPEPPAPTNQPRATSPRKRAAASANGKLARGTKTPEGLARSAMNSRKHGLTAATVVIRAEDAAQYEELRAAYQHDVSPRNQVESDLLDLALSALWRKRRALAMESAAYDLEIERQAPDIARQFNSISPDVRTWLAFRADPNLQLLYRYDARLTREYTRSLRLLRDLLSNPPLDHSPEPTSNHQPPTSHEQPATSNEKPNEANPTNEHTTLKASWRLQMNTDPPAPSEPAAEPAPAASAAAA